MCSFPVHRPGGPRVVVLAAWLLAAVSESASAAATPGAGLKAALRAQCLGCHSTEKHKGDLDLESVIASDRPWRHVRAWESVVEQVTLGEMPPKDAPQPSPRERERMVRDVRSWLDRLGRGRAGDPGPVVLRRLNNAEYAHTLRDLTGVDSLDPAREFPADSAAGEGFMNVGGALAMSPALAGKYLDAAKRVAGHLVPLPDGVAFSPSTSPRDWTEERLAAIRAFYARYTVNGGGSSVDLQGIRFDTKDGGVAPLERYLAATLELRSRSPVADAEIRAAATRHDVNARYLGTLLAALRATDASAVLGPIRARWRAAPPAGAGALAQEIGRWQRASWRFTQVGHIGKRDGPKAWQEPVTPLAEAQEVRFRVPAATNGVAVLHLAATDAGGGPPGVALWSNPRLVAKDRPDVALRLSGGLDPALFGKHPHGGELAPDDLCVRAPSVLEVRLPAAVAEGRELVVTARPAPGSGADTALQMRVQATRPAGAGPFAGDVREAGGKTRWSDGAPPAVSDVPILASRDGAAWRRFERDFAEFRALFPAALCYTKLVPVDEVVTLTLYHREDEALRRLVLDAAGTAELDRLWAELRFVSQEAPRLVDAFEQLWQYATQDADPSAFEPLREPLRERAEAFRRAQAAAGPRQVEAVIRFAADAYRRPLSAAETDGLRALYGRLRGEELDHDAALRLLLARVLVVPPFLYRLETAPEGDRPRPVNDHELAVRLSYFLWSSAPDAELRAAADAGRLHEPAVLAAQARRMARDPRVRRLATEFGCAWLHVHGFDTLSEKSERHFPDFPALRGAMYEEPIRFFTALFREDGRVTDILDADHAHLNRALARHYGVTGAEFAGEDDWRRVEGVRRFGRGGVLTMAAVLSRQSGASRTSPILRGNWLAEVLLGEKLPRPPKDVPRLPEEEPDDGSGVRRMTERHSADPRCAGCHRRIDPYGFALEGYDAVGRRRVADGASPADVRTRTADGAEIDGADGLRRHLLTRRRDAFLDQFCRKLLGYALGRATRLSDGPLVAEMRARLRKQDFKVGAALEAVVLSRQFREIRGGDMAADD